MSWEPAFHSLRKLGTAITSMSKRRDAQMSHPMRAIAPVCASTSTKGNHTIGGALENDWGRHEFLIFRRRIDR